jgi:hypothetical protein
MHTHVQEDQEKVAAMLAPYIAPDGRVIAPPDDDVLFLKQGLDLRLQEFEEDCRRIQVGKFLVSRVYKYIYVYIYTYTYIYTLYIYIYIMYIYPNQHT